MKKLTSLLLAMLLSVSALSFLPQAVCFAAEEPEPVPVIEPVSEESGEPVAVSSSDGVIGTDRNDS